MSRSDFHENYSHELAGALPSNRSFGFTVGGVFCALGLLRAFWGHRGLWEVLFLLAGLFLLLAAALAAERLTPLNRGWMRLGLLLSRVVNPVVLGVLFLFCMVPTGLVMRLFGYDPLRRKFEPQAESYWQNKPETATGENMVYQF